MTGAVLAQLLVRFGPIALDWASDLAEVWSKEMSKEEVKAWCAARRKTYDEYIQQEISKRGGV